MVLFYTFNTFGNHIRGGSAERSNGSRCLGFQTYENYSRMDKIFLEQQHIFEWNKHIITAAALQSMIQTRRTADVLCASSSRQRNAYKPKNESK